MTPLWTIPVTECAVCGRPARRLEVWPHARVVVHGAQRCQLPRPDVGWRLRPREAT